MNQTKPFDGGHGKGMGKSAHSSGSVGSSNPRPLRGWWLHHHGGGVCQMSCAFCVLSDS